MLKKCIAVLVGILLSLPLAAQLSDYAYLYIEGDKETPFYVKLEGKMMPRLGQNYTILSNLDAGVTNIEILFQQNKYAPLRFAIQVPKQVGRGLMLRKVEDNFALVDLQTGQYIFPGNKGSDDNVTALENKYYNTRKVNFSNTPTKEQTVVKVESPKVKEELPSFKPETKKEPKVVKDKTVEHKKEKVVKVKEQPTPEKETPAKKNPKYLDNVVINKDNSTNANEADESEEATTSSNVSPGSCQVAMGDAEFDTFLQKLKSKDDEARIKFLQKSKKHCFSTEQISYIGRAIPSASGRLQVLQQLYAQTTDQQNYEMLEHLFKTEYLKKKFKDNIPK